jgi:hypothetical protein
VRYFIEQFAGSIQIPALEKSVDKEIGTVCVGIEACLDDGSIDMKVRFWSG